MGTNYWHAPNYKKWEHMSKGEKVATVILYPPMLAGFIWMMCIWFYWSAILIWLIVEPIIELILAIIKGVIK